MIYDVEYAPAPGRPDCFYARSLDHPTMRMDIAGETEIGRWAAHCIAKRTGDGEVTVRVRKVDRIPGRDAPLTVESPDVLKTLQRLDAEFD